MAKDQKKCASVEFLRDALGEYSKRLVEDLDERIIADNNRSYDKGYQDGMIAEQQEQEDFRKIEEQKQTEEILEEDNSSLGVLSEKHSKLVGQVQLIRQRMERDAENHDSLCRQLNALSSEINKINEFLETIASYKEHMDRVSVEEEECECSAAIQIMPLIGMMKTAMNIQRDRRLSPKNV
jgi:hypothetical protein